MAFPDKFYLWTGTEAQSDQGEPTYTIDAHPIFQPYLKHTGLTADKISGQSLELIVASWIGEIIHAEKPPENLENSQHWLTDSGLYAALVGGAIVYEAAT
jgi:hypothetical protein